MSISWNKESGIWERIPYTPEEEAFWRERARFDARCNEASALYNAEKRGEKRGEERANVKWQSVVANKDEEIARLREQLDKKI